MPSCYAIGEPSCKESCFIFGDMKTRAGDVSPAEDPPWLPASFMPGSPQSTRRVDWRWACEPMAAYISLTMPSISRCFGCMFGLSAVRDADFAMVERRHHLTFLALPYGRCGPDPNSEAPWCSSRRSSVHR